MLDKLDLENKLLLDDKTTGSLQNFDSSHLIQQLAWYRMLVREGYGVLCDCYGAAGDKGATYTKIKRSNMYHVPSSRLDYQEELNIENLERLLQAKKDNHFPPCNELDSENREYRCFGCDHYNKCPHSRQKEFIILQ